MIVVSNSTPIISLATVGHIPLLSALFGRIAIPREVEHELKSNKYPGYQDIYQEWCDIRDVQGTLYVGFLCHDLDRGEAEAITLAKELRADALILMNERDIRLPNNRGFMSSGH